MQNTLFILAYNLINIAQASSPRKTFNNNSSLIQSDAAGSSNKATDNKNLDLSIDLDALSIDTDNIIPQGADNQEQPKESSGNVDFKSNTIFHFIDKAMTFVLSNKKEINSIVASLHKLLKSDRKDEAMSLLHHIYIYLGNERDYYTRTRLDNFGELPYSHKDCQNKHDAIAMQQLLFIANKHPENDSTINLKSIKKRVYKTFEYLGDIDMPQLVTACVDSQMEVEEIVKRLELSEVGAFLDLLRIINDLALCIPFVFTNIDRNYLMDEITGFGVVCNTNSPFYTAENSLFMFCIEFLLYLYKINFIPGSTISTRNTINYLDIFTISKYVNVLNNMIVAQTADKKFQLQTPTIQHIESEVSKRLQDSKHKIEMINIYTAFYKAICKATKNPNGSISGADVQNFLNSTIGMLGEESESDFIDIFK